jgi:hydroxymethylglutaryl-CoA lyase
MNDAVVLCECFARDGLQHEAGFVATADKIAAIDRFARLGFGRVEATSFSHPKNVPQFTDADGVLRGIARAPGTSYKATCVNLRSVERALAARAAGYGPDEISVLLSATEQHTRRNLNRTRAEQWANVEAMIAAANGQFTIVGTVSVALGCPFEGFVDPSIVVDDAARLAALGVRFIAVGDTTGMGNPLSVRGLFTRLLAEIPAIAPVAHFHDTRGSAIANCIAALEAGVRHFDSAFGGVGGHPAKIRYGGGFTGNVCTEDLATLLESMGVSTGLDIDALIETALFCETVLDRELRGMTTRSGLGLVGRASAEATSSEGVA